MTANEQKDLTLLLEAIGMPQEMCACLLDETSEPLPGTDVLRTQLLQGLENRRDGPWKGLPEDVFLATFGAFSRFVREHRTSYGICGFDRGFWTTRQVEAKLFRIGELEYELTQKEGRPVISLHIPGDAKLEAPLLNESAASMRAFFARFFPERKDDPVFLSSWLLSPALKDLLPDTSRILAFQRSFGTEHFDPEPVDCLEWVFQLAPGQIESADLSSLPEKTTLQKNMKAFLLSGGKVGCADGFLVRPFAGPSDLTS